MAIARHEFGRGLGPGWRFAAAAANALLHGRDSALIAFPVLPEPLRLADKRNMYEKGNHRHSGEKHGQTKGRRDDQPNAVFTISISHFQLS
jgi:hypothetical protein